jgi:hypothetical protein
LAFPAYWFFLSIFSVTALSMNTLTAIFSDLLVIGELHSDLLRLGGLVLADDDGAVVECCCLQLSASVCRAPRTSPMQPTRQSCYNGLEGGEGNFSSVLAFHVVLLRLSSLNVHLHGDPLGLGVAVLVGLLLNVVLDILENVCPSVDGELGLGVLLCLGSLHNLVLLGSLHVNVGLDEVDSWRRSRRHCPRIWGS